MITERNIKQAKRFCKDDYRKIPGYEIALKHPDRFGIHHVLGLTLDGQHAHSKEELKRLDMYYHRPYFELQWISLKEHGEMHKLANPVRLTGSMNPNYGKHISEKQRKAISESLRGGKSYLYGKTGEKHPNWKGDKVGVIGAYVRAKKLYKAGKITEEEFQPYRDAKAEYIRTRRSKSSKTA